MIDQFVGEYRWLSNFWPSDVVFDREIYPTVEHAYQAAKTLDDKERARIRMIPGAGAVKRLSKTLVLRDDWELVKLGVMTDLVRQKFADPVLRAKLDATRGQALIEGNTWGDTFWGQCNGRGHNYLGRILMELRDAEQLPLL